MDRTQELVWFYYLVAAGFGLIFGSFFNVVIYRLPNEMSLGDRSKCPLCGMTIRWYDNIPLVSYVVLRGRCRGCKAPISIRYPLIEATTSGLFVLIYWWSRNVVPSELGLPAGKVITPELFIGLLMVSVLVIVSVVDITHGIVPNRVIYPGLVLMFLLVTGIAIYRGQPGRIGLSVATAATGAGFLLAAGLIYGALFLRGRVTSDEEPKAPGGKPAAEDEVGEDEEDEYGIPTGIGMGDVKMIAFTGLALGFFHWYLIIVQIFAGFLIGALASIPMLILAKKGRQDKLAFAPFLAAGAVIALVWGQQLVDLYLKLLR
jgi:leader peptidase (prepilin peptidase)/N-methyltransferase